MSRAYAYRRRLRLGPRDPGTPHPEDPGKHRLSSPPGRRRILAGESGAAQTGYEEILRIAPRNADALAGLARLAAARNDDSAAERYFLESLALAPDNAEVAYSLGLLYRWQGAFEKARECLPEARRIDPSNAEYKKALTRMPGRAETKYELRLIYQPETFTDGRADLSKRPGGFYPGACRKTGRRSSSKGNGRAGSASEDDQFGVEAYPRLWQGGSAYLDVNFSPGGAKSVSQGLRPSGDLPGPVRRLRRLGRVPVDGFRGGTDFDLFRLARLVFSDAFYSCARVYFSPESRESRISWLFLTRWYFAGPELFLRGLRTGDPVHGNRRRRRSGFRGRRRR